MTDILDRLSSHTAMMAPHQKTREAGALLIGCRDEIMRLRTRLEVDPEFPDIDGIFCRDQTIKLQDAEIERLRETVKNLDNTLDFERGSLRAAFQSVDGLRAEIESLRKDAERYRGIRSLALQSKLEAIVALEQLDHISNSDDIDSTVDSLLSEQALQTMADEAQADGEYR